MRSRSPCARRPAPGWVAPTGAGGSMTCALIPAQPAAEAELFALARRVGRRLSLALGRGVNLGVGRAVSGGGARRAFRDARCAGGALGFGLEHAEPNGSALSTENGGAGGAHIATYKDLG